MDVGSSCSDVAPSLAYEKPSLKTILVVSAFLLLLNVLHDLVDQLLYAGILAQVILGAVFGAPLANILPTNIQSAIQSIGYLGLLLLVFEGGMATRLDILSSPSTLLLALGTGMTGILMPIALSMIFLPFALRFTYLESFVVGAALSSTSLGTTLAVISATSHAVKSGKDAEKTSPASLHIDGAEGARDTSNQSVQAAEPDAEALHSPTGSAGGILNTRIGTILIGAALLDDIVALVLNSVIASLGAIADDRASGTISVWSIVRPILSSVLILAGTVLGARFVAKPAALRIFSRQIGIPGWLAKYWPQLGITLWLAIISAFVSLADETYSTDLIGIFCAGALVVYIHRAISLNKKSSIRAMDPQVAYDAVRIVQDRILSPFFFASIGFAIPVKDLFHGSTVWKGILFSGLMGIAKVMGCLPVLIVSLFGKRIGARTRLLFAKLFRIPNSPVQTSYPPIAALSSRKPRKWPPAIFLGFALVARGEIGFLIINTGRQVGILSCSASSSTALQAFDIGVWAITLNTFIGPTVIGILLRAKGMLDEIEKGRWGLVNG